MLSKTDGSGDAPRHFITPATRAARGRALFPVLAERSRQPAGTLSGGEQQMLAIGRALMAGPRLLMLDEPSLGLAPLAVRQVVDRLLLLRSRGTTVLLVEQNTRAALRVATRGYLLERGSVALAGTADELRDASAVAAAYLGTTGASRTRNRCASDRQCLVRPT